MHALHRGRVIVMVVLAVAFAFAWRAFAPSQLGGSTTFAVTEGISMEPRFHAGDLAVVRSATTYSVGDIVLYHSSVVRRPVLHRIILRQGGNYFLQGDNNDFVDPGYATRSQIVGKLWARIPRLGGWLGWFGHPRNAAAIAMLTVLAVGLTMVPSRRRRSRRKGRAAATSPTRIRPGQSIQPADLVTLSGRLVGGDIAVNTAPSHAAEPLVSDRSRSFIDGPLPTLVGLIATVFGAGLLLCVGFALPSHKAVAVANAYRQSGSFSYVASPRMRTPVYPRGVVKTGDPIYPSLVNAVRLSFAYRFTTASTHRVHGTIGLRALLQSPDGTWQSLRKLTPSTSFRGDSASVTTVVTLRKLYALIDTVVAQSGSQPGSYSADIEPVVHVQGTVDGRPFHSAFSPTLPLEIDPSAITLRVVVGPPPPGATYIPPTREEELEGSLTPSTSGALPGRGANTITVARYHPTVIAIRAAGLALVGLALVLLAVHDILRRRQTARSAEELQARRVGVPLVLVEELHPDGYESVQVQSFASLLELARYLERPVLYMLERDVCTFAVDDGTRKYRFVRPSAADPLDEERVASPSDHSGHPATA